MNYPFEGQAFCSAAVYFSIIAVPCKPCDAAFVPSQLAARLARHQSIANPALSTRATSWQAGEKPEKQQHSWVDAWEALLTEIKPAKVGGPKQGYVGLVTTNEHTGRQSLAPRVLQDIAKNNTANHWLELRPHLSHLSGSERGNVKLALEVAALAHHGQYRKSGAPFIEHPVAVARTLAELKMDADAIMAGFLHDTVEDTSLTVKEIEMIFGPIVASLVEGETKVSTAMKFSGLSPKDREDAQLENLRALFLAMASDLRIIFIKLADRKHNMATLEWMPPHKQLKISQETLDIFAPLADRLGLRTIKAEMEENAMKYLYPEAYQYITKRLYSRAEYHRRILSKAYEDLNAILESKHLDQPQSFKIMVHGRLKEKYSLMRKMQRKSAEEGRQVDVDEIGDVIAMRIIISVSREPEESEPGWKQRGIYLCYRVMYLILKHMSDKSTLGVEDYISVPKPNGYRSLHADIIRDGQAMEVQVRTDWMHEVAERGMASHFLYKDDQERRGSKARSHYQAAWLTCLKEWDAGLSRKDFVEAVRSEILGKRVNFFLKNGRLHDLPRGSTVLDAAFRLHKAIGLHLRLAEVNGRPAPLDQIIENGDVLFCIPTRNAKPSPHWCSAAYCRTTRAKVRQYFKNIEPNSAMLEGQRLVWEWIRRNAAVIEGHLGRLPKEEELQNNIEHSMGYVSVFELYSQVALATAEPSEMVAMLARVLGLKTDMIHALDSQPLSQEARMRRQRGKQEPVSLLSRDRRQIYHLCSDCAPCDGDSLIVSKNPGCPESRILHRANTRCLQRQKGTCSLQPVPPVLLHEDEDALYPVSVIVQAEMILYVLSNLVSTLEAAGALLLDAGLAPQGDTSENVHQEWFRFLMGVRDVRQLKTVMEKMLRVKGVLRVARSQKGHEREAELKRGQQQSWRARS